MTTDVEAFSIDLPADTTAPRLARSLVAERLGDHERLQDLLLCVSEVVTNAVLHAGSPGAMRVHQTDDTLVVEVTDGDPRLPTRRQHDLEAPTGRGLHLLDALTIAWGTSPADDGKIVWFEFDLGRPASADGERTGRIGRIELRGLPIPVHRRATEHGEALRRELALVQHSTSPDVVLVRLQELGTEIGERVGGMNDLTDERLAQAVADDLPEVDLSYQLPIDAAEVFERLVPLLEELDQYCVDRDLLTLVTPPEGLAYRSWYLTEIIEQLRDGRPPRRWSPPSEAAPADPSDDGTADAPLVSTVIRVTGDLDLERAPGLREEIVRRTDAGATELEVDLAECTFLDSTGLSVLVTTHLRLQAEGGSLRLTNLSRQVASVLELSGLTDVMT